MAWNRYKTIQQLAIIARQPSLPMQLMPTQPYLGKVGEANWPILEKQQNPTLDAKKL
jgi:hypothetical protein